MGFALTIAVVILVVWRGRAGKSIRLLDITLLCAAVVLPLGMAAFPGAAGLLQRLMFAVAYAWFFRSASIGTN